VKGRERTYGPGQGATRPRRTVASVAYSMYEEYKEPLYAAPPLLQRMVDAGRLGRKSGSGFYAYG
jgi:3-hydroxybutyryl-CoA dehydrogenase